MTRHQIFTLCFFAVVLLLLYQVALVFRPFLFPVLWAVVLAHLTFPLHGRLSALFRGRQTISAAALTTGIMALGVLPVIMLSVLLVGEAGSAQVAITTWIQSGGVEQLRDEIAKLPLGSGRMEALLGWITVEQGNLKNVLIESSKAVSQFLVEEVTGLVKNALLLAADFLVMIFTLFFFFKDGQRLFESLYQLIPLEESHKQLIFSRLDQTIRAVVKGLIITAIVQGLLAGAAYMVLGVPFPVFLTALTMLLAPLPFGGTALVWGPVALYLYWVKPLWKALAMLVWGVGIVSTVDHVLKPILIGKGAQIPFVLLFFSVLGGLAAYGLIGLFLGPILVGLLITAMQIYREEYQHLEEPGIRGT
ncbi:MAG TPA: AI-2E family transporter [Nitrospiraceae bacterium]|nr:AI-2E family transporter [Nitrospiraceae bacterium]